VKLVRIAQLSSAATYDNGTSRYRGDGLEGERVTVIADFMDDIEEAGFRIRGPVLRMWDGERDRGALLEGLDGPSRRVMGWLLDRLAVEEAGEAAASSSSDDGDAEKAAAMMEAKLAEEALTTALLAADPSAGGGGRVGRERLLDFLEVLPFFSQGFAGLRAALEGVFAGQRDEGTLCRGLSLRAAAFVRMVLRELYRPAAELRAEVVGGGEDFDTMRSFEPPPAPSFPHPLPTIPPTPPLPTQSTSFVVFSQT
jgi:hypothetical protein